MKDVRRQNEALVSFIGYKGTADWLLARISKWTADRLILYPNHQTKLLECFQDYEGYLLCLNNGSHMYIVCYDGRDQ